MSEYTFAMLKPDALYRGHVGDILNDFETAGLTIPEIDVRQIDEPFAQEHYDGIAEEHGEDVMDALVAYVTCGPVMPFVLQGREPVETARRLVGDSFDPTECRPGTIRSDYSSYSQPVAEDEGVALPNLVHTSGNKVEAEREIDLWFPDRDFAAYEQPGFEHIRTMLGDASEQ